MYEGKEKEIKNMSNYSLPYKIVDKVEKELLSPHELSKKPKAICPNCKSIQAYRSINDFLRGSLLECYSCEKRYSPEEWN